MYALMFLSGSARIFSLVGLNTFKYPLEVAVDKNVLYHLFQSSSFPKKGKTLMVIKASDPVVACNMVESITVL